MNRRTKETQSNAGINSALQGGGRPKVKSFGQKSWMLPQPVLIIGTYDKNGKPNAIYVYDQIFLRFFLFKLQEVRLRRTWFCA